MKRIAAAVAAVGIAGSAAGYAFFSESQTLNIKANVYWQTMRYNYTTGQVATIPSALYGNGITYSSSLNYGHHYGEFLYDYQKGRFSEFFYYSNQIL